MNLIIVIMLFLRFLQTVAYIGLSFFLLIKVKEPKKKRISITVAIYILITVVFFVVSIFCGQKTAEMLFVPIEIGLCLILIFICSADKLPVSLFIMFSQFNLYIGISYLSDICTTVDSGLLCHVQYFIYRTVLFTSLLVFIFKIIRPRFRKLAEIMGKEWNLISLVAFFFYVLEFFILYYPQMYWYESDYRWYLVASSYLLFFGVYGLILWLFINRLDKYEINERERILIQQNKMWEEQIEVQKNAVSAARRDRHDLRHHYDSILAMLEAGETAEAILYLNMQTQRTESMELGSICEHLVVNAILSRWVARANKNGIKTVIEASIPANLPMDEVALAGILANIFENAVEGCQRCTDEVERYIIAKIAYSAYNTAQKLYIVVENSCAENIVFENGFPKSQKPSGGIGTKSITYSAERYSGMVEFTAENGVFKTRVLLHL